MRQPRFMPAALGVTLLLVALVLPVGVRGVALAASQDGSTPVTVTKTVTRDNLVGTTVQTVDSRNVTLKVNNTTGLRGLQQIDVSWSGAHPTGGEDPDPNDGADIPQSSGSLAGGVRLEYPMVLLECRGVDSATASPAQQLSPETCWTAYEWEDRGFSSGAGTYGAFPPYRLDMYAAPADRAAYVGVPSADTVLAGTTPPTTASQVESANMAECPAVATTYQSLYAVPFVAADGATYYPQNLCEAFPAPAEAASQLNQGQLTFPSNETWAATAPNGTGSAHFDLFTSNENASLGCSDTVPCALVAIPIMGISCDAAGAGLPPEDQPSASQIVTNSDGTTQTVQQAAQSSCSAAGNQPSGVNGLPPGEDSVAGELWWSASNWRNRITVPLTFASVSNPCNAQGRSGQEVDIYGSELMTEAAAQWDPHFCTDASLFTLKQIATGEPEARNLLEQGDIEAAFAAYAPTGTYSSPVVSAPVALSGFAIAFNVDSYDGREVTTLRLDPRLIAKLLTESYLDSISNFQQVLPTLPPTSTELAIAKNPLNITQDPEFIALNPEFGQNLSTTNAFAFRTSEEDGAATLYSLSSQSDVMYALTSYIMEDPEAVAWLEGQPDPWGAVVNPSYKLPSSPLTMPTSAWQLLDRVTSTAGIATTNNDGNVCPQLSQTPWLNLVASPQATLLSIAEGVEFANSFSTTKCVQLTSQKDQNSAPNVLKTQGAQVAGEHFMLGLVSLGEASRYDLNTASLETDVKPGTPAGQFAPTNSRTFVAPTDASLKAAAALITADPGTNTWQIPPGLIQSTPADAGAYPGTMVVQAQVPTSGLPAADATNLSKFLQFAATDGQTPGAGYGLLPGGYLPMTAGNGMGNLVAYTQAAAAAVAAQNGQVPSLAGSSAGAGAGGDSTTGSVGGHGGGGGQGGEGASPSATATATTGGSKPSGTGGGSTGRAARAPGLVGRAGSPAGTTDAPTGPVAAVTKLFGKTLGIISGVAGSLVQWLAYLALLGLAAAGVVFLIGRRRGLDVRGLTAMVRELVQGRLAQKRAR